MHLVFCSGRVGILFGRRAFRTKEKCTAFRSALGHHSFNEVFRLGTRFWNEGHILCFLFLTGYLILERKNNCFLFHSGKMLAFCSTRVTPDVISIKLAKIAIFANMLGPSQVM